MHKCTTAHTHRGVQYVQCVQLVQCCATCAGCATCAVCAGLCSLCNLCSVVQRRGSLRCLELGTTGTTERAGTTGNFPFSLWSLLSLKLISREAHHTFQFSVFTFFVISREAHHTFPFSFFTFHFFLYICVLYIGNKQIKL